MQRHYDNYFLIGPHIQEELPDEFEPEEPPTFLQKSFEDMDAECHYGTWDIDGAPKTILVRPAAIGLDQVKAELWMEHDIDSIDAGIDFDNPLQWSWTVGELVETAADYLGEMTTVLHCHEWMSGFALLRTDNVNTAFTTHATMLGRSLAGSGRDIYHEMDDIDPDEAAKDVGVTAKHTTERACARAADVFTTVSEITAIEAEAFLGESVDVILNNGMNTEKFPTIEDTTLMHVENRDLVREFLTYFFFPYYTFPLEHNLIFYFVGRFEYKNKGVDVFIDALDRLNERLKDVEKERTISAFFFTPMENDGIRHDVRENKRYYTQIKTVLERHEDDIMDKLVMDAVSQQCTLEESIFTSDYLEEVQQDVEMFKRGGKPPVSTHRLQDNIVQDELLANGLDNKEDDPVKSIIYPVYLDGDDDLVNLPYYEMLSAGHLGVFPSYYEPWGYTPVEAISLGVPAITTDLAGFGRFIQDKTLDDNPGVYILERFQQSRDEVVDRLADEMYEFAMKDHAERVQNKINAKQMSKLTGWDHFVKNYVEAHEQAVQGTSE